MNTLERLYTRRRMKTEMVDENHYRVHTAGRTFSVRLKEGTGVWVVDEAKGAKVMRLDILWGSAQSALAYLSNFAKG